MWAPEWKRRQVRAMREAREAMNDRTMVEFPGGDAGDVTRADQTVWQAYQQQAGVAGAAGGGLVIRSHAMPVPNHVANLEAEIARLRAELAAARPAPAADIGGGTAGKGTIPARTLRQPATQRIGLLVGRV